MADQIVINGIRGFGFHGVLASERAEGQEFVVDVALDVEIAKAATSDDLADTVDYATVASAVHALIVGEPFDLIETLAERIAGTCLVPGVARVEVVVHKPHAPIPVPFDDVAIRVERHAGRA